MKIMIVEDPLLNSIGHDSDSNTLELRFNDGEIRHYLGISDSIFNGLTSSKSPSVYFQKNIANNYPFKKIEYSYNTLY